MASQDLHLLSSRESHRNMNVRICLSFIQTCTHHSSLLHFFTEEGTHLPQSDYVQPSLTTALHRSFDLSTFPRILSSHEPLWTFLCHPIPGYAAAPPGLEPDGTEEKKSIWILDPHTAANTKIKVFWNSFILQNRFQYIKICIFFPMSDFVNLFVVVIFKWPQPYLHLRKGWSKKNCNVFIPIML